MTRGNSSTDMSIFESILGCTNKFDDSLFSKKSIYARDSVPKRGEEKDIGGFPTDTTLVNRVTEQYLMPRFSSRESHTFPRVAGRKTEAEGKFLARRRKTKTSRQSKGKIRIECKRFCR